MAKDKKSVLLYCDIIHTVNKLNNEQAGVLFKHYLSYINDLNPISPDQLTEIVFEPIKQNLKRDLKKWEEKSERNSLIAKEGWIMRKDANARERIKKDAKDAVNVNVTVNDTVNVKEINIVFSAFWDLYDKKVGSKDKCEKKWNKLTDEERQKIIDTLPKFKTLISDKQFQPFPETYLNAKRWNDNLDIKSNMDSVDPYKPKMVY